MERNKVLEILNGRDANDCIEPPHCTSGQIAVRALSTPPSHPHIAVIGDRGCLRNETYGYFLLLSKNEKGNAAINREGKLDVPLVIFILPICKSSAGMSSRH